jgi:ribosomal protein L16/L10AE
MEYIIGDTNATIAHALRDAGIKLPYKHITVVKE